MHYHNIPGTPLSLNLLSKDCAYPQYWSEPVPGRPDAALWSGYQIWALMDILRLIGKADTRFEFDWSTEYNMSDTTYNKVHPLLQVKKNQAKHSSKTLKEKDYYFFKVILFNKDDFLPSFMGFTPNRYLYFDFGAPSFFFDTTIFSRKSIAKSTTTSSIQGIFDLPTYILTGISLLLVACMLWCDFGLSMAAAVTRTLGMAFSSDDILLDPKAKLDLR